MVYGLHKIFIDRQTETNKNCCLYVMLGDRDLIGLDEDSRLLFFAAEADLDESIVLRKSLLTRHPCITIMTRLVDAHLYLISKWVIEYLTDNRLVFPNVFTFSSACLLTCMHACMVSFTYVAILKQILEG